MNCIANYISLVEGAYFCTHPGNLQSKPLTDLCSSRTRDSVCCLLILSLCFTCFLSPSPPLQPPHFSPSQLPSSPSSSSLIYYFLLPLYLSKNLFYSVKNHLINLFPELYGS